MTPADRLLAARRAFDQAADHDTRMVLLNQMVTLTKVMMPGDVLEAINLYGGMSTWMGWAP